MAENPERAEYPGPDEFWVCARCRQPVRDDERDCPRCGPEPCGECRSVACECDLMADEVDR